MSTQWSVMVYMAGNNSLSDAVDRDLVEMRKVGSTNEVKVLTFVKQEGGGGARRMQIEKGGQGEVPERLGNVDSGNPQTVVDFIRWGVAKAPAERYALVLWNHGGGWAPDDIDQLYGPVRGKGAPARGEVHALAKNGLALGMFSSTILQILSQPTWKQRQICNDDGSRHSIDTVELGRLLKRAKEAVGDKIDVLGMDACLMSTFEVAYQVHDDARVVVGSEETEPNAGWPYDRVLRDLTANPDMDAADLGRAIVKQYVASYMNNPLEGAITHCAVNTSRADRFARALDTLERSLESQLLADYRPVQTAQLNSVSFGVPVADLTDLMTFCRYLVGSPRVSADVRAAAQAVIEALRPGDYVVEEGHVGPEVEGCGGITVYFPKPGGHISDYYKDLRFAKHHRWDQFLSAFQKAVREG